MATIHPLPSPRDNRPLAAKARALVDWFAGYQSCAVAFSAGVDSTLVAHVATHALGPGAWAVTADSPSLPRHELAAACSLARELGFQHRVITTSELAQAGYRANAGNRCFFCKDELYRQLESLAAKFAVEVIVNGANCDDLGEHRPGLMAAEEHAIRSPLVECELTKSEVRELAGLWGLPNWDKPAAPCLASRVAYGVEITPARLAMVEHGEAYLRSLGFVEFRLRLHSGDLARLEVPAADISRVTDPALRGPLIARLQQLGFRFVTLDLLGFRSGSLNVLVPAEQLMIGIDRIQKAAPGVK